MPIFVGPPATWVEVDGRRHLARKLELEPFLEARPIADSGRWLHLASPVYTRVLLVLGEPLLPFTCIYVILGSEMGGGHFRLGPFWITEGHRLIDNGEPGFEMRAGDAAWMRDHGGVPGELPPAKEEPIEINALRDLLGAAGDGASAARFTSEGGFSGN